MKRLNIRLLKTWPAYLASLLILLSGCVDSYTPAALSTPPNYLVVDGFINLSGITTVRLTHTRSLSTGAASPPETQATVTIVDEGGARYPLAEQAAGTYTSAVLMLSAGRRYQLQLRTSAGAEYASSLVAGKVAPAIDNLSWDVVGDNVRVYVDTHDPANATRYYRWLYQETWEFYSPYRSDFEYVGGSIRPRSDDINHCWRSENSANILVSNTARLSQDVVTQFPLAAVPLNSAKLGYTYSILVQQLAESAEESAYWEKLRQNTESLGTLFDPLPSQLAGNVHNLSDASEQVLGYVGVSSVAEKRLFIARTQLPVPTRAVTGYETCTKPDTVALNNVAAYFGSLVSLPVYGVYAPGTGTLVGYAGAKADCVDCRLRGTNVKPGYWP